MTSPTTTPEPTLRGGLRRLALRVVLVTVALVTVAAGLLSAGLSSAAVAADTCANATARAQTGSTGLPDCRAYEMVSPPYKEGFPVTPRGFSDDGIVSYQSRGSFAGDAHGSLNNLYHSLRTATGWETSSQGPSSVTYNTSLGGALALPVTAESADLRWSLWRMFRRDEPENRIAYWLRSPDGTFTRIGDAFDRDYLGVRGSSAADLSHVVLNNGEGDAGLTALREYVGVGNGGPPRAVSVDNGGLPTSGVSCLGDVSSDGRVIVFGSGCGGLLRLWARVGGSATVAVSGSECTRSAGDVGGLCSGLSAAAYVGAAVDGSRVFFTTSQQLVNGDIDQTDDLYACDIPVGVPVAAGSANACSTLTEVSAPPPEGAASGAGVQSVVAVSDDGSRVYFVARGVLADNLGVGDVGPRAVTPAVPEPHNLYLWQRDAGHPAGATRFVSRLDSNDVARAQMTPDGRYLLLTTANQLVASGAGADTDSATDVYRYDAVTHSIVRVSTSVAGGGGNDPGPPASPFDVSIPGGSAMSADGSVVVFGSAEALSVGDTNGVSDVYGWRDGQVSLISAGGARALGVTPSGRDVFFTTDAPVLAADGDINTDIYDARVGGGFEQVQAPSSCSGDQCQGPVGQAPGLAGPPAGLPGGGVLGAMPSVLSVRAVSATQRKALAASGRISLTVTSNAPGTVGVVATATIGGRSTVVGSGRQTLTVPGRVVVALTLSKRARSRLASRGKLTVKVAVSHSKVALDRAVTLRLVHAKAKAKAKAKRSVRRVSVKRVSVRGSVAGVGGGRS